MSLWGNSDNVTSRGTVTLDYTANAAGTFDVTGNSGGSGTQFGQVGSAKTGDIIRFGLRGEAGTGGVYFGDAVIVGITSNRSLTIGSTAGLSGAAIAATSFYVSELPKYTVEDHAWSNKHDNPPTYKTVHRKAAYGAVGVGSTTIAVYWKGLDLSATGAGRDALLNNGTQIKLAGIGTAVSTVHHTAGVGTDKIYVSRPNGTTDASIVVNQTSVAVTKYGVGAHRARITSIAGAGASTVVTIGSTINTAITAGTSLVFHGDHIISLGGVTAAAIANEEELQFQRLQEGYDKQIYGVGYGDLQRYNESTGKYRTSSGGWVGVTTYIDSSGELRVKSEILVAVGSSAAGDVGITTGTNGIPYPTNA